MNKLLKKDEGITGYDLVVSIIVLCLFVGVLTTLMGNLYKTSANIQASAIAMSYATIVSEKVDEKSFEEVTDDKNFANYLAEKGEIELDDNYKITVIVSKLSGVDENYIKNVNILVTYNVANESKSISLTKLKVKEVAKN